MKMTLKSGATLDVTRSPFVIGHKLFKTVLKEMKQVNLKLGLKEGQSFGSLASLELTDDALNTVKDAFCILLSSEEIEEVLWECMLRSTYNGRKIDKALFNEDPITADYLEVAKEVMTINLIPFRQSLESLFPRIRLQKTIENQK